MAKRYITSLLLALTLSLFAAAYANDNEAGEKKPVGIDFFTKVKRISNLKEKDGEIFFIVSQPDQESDRNSVSDLYQLINGEPVRLAKNVSDYFFRDDGIIFRDVREDKDREKIRNGEQLTVFQKLSKGYQEAGEWVRLPFLAGQIEWIDKDRFFYTSSYDHHFELLLKESNGNRQEALKKQRKAKEAYRVFDELPFWSDGRGDVSGLRTHLFYYDKGEITLLSDTLESASSPELSPDKKTLVYTNRAVYYGKAPQGNSLTSLDVNTLEKKEWALFDKASYGDYQFVNNDEIVLTINRGLERDKIENAGIYRLNLRTEELTEIYDGSVYALGNSVNTDIGGSGRSKITFDKDGIRYITTHIDYAPLIHLSYKDAGIRFLTPDNITVQEYLPYKDGFLVVGLLEQHGSEIYFIDKKGNAAPLTSLNKPLFDEHKIVKPVEITFTNEEGRQLNGYVLPPADYEKGKKYPGIFTIHGGPKGAYGTVFFHEMQYWANQGYAVFYTNPRGSSGRGSEFSDIRGKIGVADYNDLIDFTDAVLQQVDYIDGERLGVTGGSYGGLLTNWIIGQTDRFKAAASLRGISSWLTHSNTSDIGHTYLHNYWGTDIWKNGQLLWDRSPLKYADRIKTPTLFLHSEEDYRCWLVEAVQLYYALQYFEVPSRLVIFKDESHGLSRSGKPSNRIKRLEEITEWFNTYL
jgi:Dipeptidyl aminopeptidases/acylaminoacyl-peptidases